MCSFLRCCVERCLLLLKSVYCVVVVLFFSEKVTRIVMIFGEKRARGGFNFFSTNVVMGSFGLKLTSVLTSHAKWLSSS